MDEEELAALAEAEKNAAEEAAKLEEAKRKLDEDNEKSKKKSPTDAEAKLLKELMKQKQALKDAEAKAKALEERISGVDLDAAREALKQLEDAENKELERKGEYDRLLAKQREAAEAAIKDREAKLAETIEQNRKLMESMNGLAISNAFSNSRFIVDKLTLTPNKAKAIYGEYFDITDGNIVAYDAPRNSPNRTPIVDSSGNNVDFETAMQQIIENDPDKEYLIKSELKSGSGAKPSNAPSEYNNKKVVDSLDKIALGLKNPKNFG